MAQVSVNHQNGAPDVSIPIASISDRDLTIPLTLVYTSSGNRPGQPVGPLGTGWELLNSVGKITRIVNGLPDDINSSTKKGWLHSSNYSTVGSYNPQADANYNVYSDEYADFNILDGFKGFDNTNVMRDTEPDVFIVNAFGLNFKFMFDNTGAITTIPDFYGKITLTYEGGNTGNPIESFVIENGGLTWQFNLSQSKTVQTFPIDVTGFTLDKRNFYMYQSAISFRSDWYLTSVKSSRGAEINYEYATYVDNISALTHATTFRSNVKDTVRAKFWNGTTWKNKDFYYTQLIQSSPLIMKEINSSNTRIEFISGSEVIPKSFDLTQVNYRAFVQHYPLMSQLNVYDINDPILDPVMKVKFNSYYSNGVDSKVKQAFLTSIYFSAREKYQNPIRFDYYGMENWVDILTNPHVIDDGSHYLRLYSGNSKKSDFFGYASSKDLFSNTTHSFNTGYEGDLLHDGMLKKILLPNGGYSQIFYEPNLWYNSVSLKNEYAGGLRVSKTILHDGVNSANDIITNYEYLDGSNSSGVLLKKPIYEMDLGFQYNPDSDLITPLDLAQFASSFSYNNTRVIFDRDQRKDLFGPYSNVGYKKVKVYQTGKGYMLYEYEFPVDWNDESDNFGNFPNIKIARKDFSSSYSIWKYGLLKATPSLLGYPMVSNPFNYFESGRLKKIAAYNQSGTLVSSEEYVYSTPTINNVKGLIIEQVPTELYYGTQGPNIRIEKDMFVYLPYIIRTGTQALMTKKIVSQRDDTGYTGSTELNFEYSSGDEPLLARQYQIDSKGNENGVRYKYARDYTTTGTLSGTAQGIRDMKSNGFENVIIETTGYSKYSGGTEKVMNASLNLYEYSGGWLCSSEQFLFTSDIPVANFSNSTINYGTSGTFSMDSRYISVMKVLSKDLTNREIITARGKFDTLTIATDDMHRPVATFDGAFSDEVGFVNFDGVNVSDGAVAFSKFPAGLWSLTIGAGRLHGKSFSMPVGNTNYIKRNIVRRKPDGSFIVSGWIKSGGSGALTLEFSDGTNPTINRLVSYSNTSGSWKFFEEKISISSLLPNVVFSLYSSTSINIDDIAIYPSEVKFSHVTYGLHDKVVGTFGEKGFGSTAFYDQLGRLTIAKDQDGSVLQNITYYTDAEEPADISQLIDLVSYEQSDGNLYAEVLPVGISGAVTIIWVISNGYDSRFFTPETVSYNTTPTGNRLKLVASGTNTSEYTVFAKIIYGASTYYKAIRVHKAN